MKLGLLIMGLDFREDPLDGLVLGRIALVEDESNVQLLEFFDHAGCSMGTQIVEENG